jgi:hypothetical protein
MNEITFTSHALGQFAKRVCVPPTDSSQKISIVWQYAKQIDRQRAFEITGDKEILKKDNKNTQYFEVPLGLAEIRSIMGEDNHTPFEDMVGLFVVKGKCCVTFKTNMENLIYSKLYSFRYTKRFFDIEGAAYK